MRARKPISLKLALVWTACSVLFLDVSIGRFTSLRAAGHAVSMWRYAQVVFWSFMLLFWLIGAWTAWRRPRAPACR